MMGGIVAKYFPECYQYEQGELEIILKAAIGSAEFHVNVEWMKQREIEKQQPSAASPVPKTYQDPADSYMEKDGDGYSDGQESSDGGYAGYSKEAPEDGNYGREW